MAELLVRVKDSPMTGDAAFDSKASRRGDVIVVMPDGWAWGSRERDHDFWRIVKMEGIPVEVAEVLLGQELDTDPQNPKQTLQFRLNRLDLDHAVLIPVAPDIADDTRTMAVIEVKGMDSVAFLGLVVRKDPIPDIGEIPMEPVFDGKVR